MIRSVNDNATYHLTDLDETRITTPIAGKMVKAFKRRNEAEPSPEPIAPGPERKKSSPESLTKIVIRHIPEDVRFSGGGCRGDSGPRAETKGNA